MKTQEKPLSLLPPLFPSSRRRYVMIPPKHLYEYIINLLREDLGLKDADIRQRDDMTLEINLGGRIGANLKAWITSEGDTSVLNINFRYGKLILLASTIFSAAIVLSILFGTFLPMLIVAALLPMAYNVNLEAVRFLDVLNETLPFLEREYNRQILLMDRDRLRRYLGKAQELYEKLCKRHISIWGNVNVLKYKIEEYQSLGLTYEEAIIKIAEEEGLIVD